MALGQWKILNNKEKEMKSIKKNYKDYKIYLI